MQERWKAGSGWGRFARRLMARSIISSFNRRYAKYSSKWGSDTVLCSKTDRTIQVIIWNDRRGSQLREELGVSETFITFLIPRNEVKSKYKYSHQSNWLTKWILLVSQPFTDFIDGISGADFGLTAKIKYFYRRFQIIIPMRLRTLTFWLTRTWTIQRNLTSMACGTIRGNTTDSHRGEDRTDCEKRQKIAQIKH